MTEKYEPSEQGFKCFKCGELHINCECKEETFKCCICKGIFEGYGNNAEPLKHGRCCDNCDLKVIEYRIKLLHERLK